LLEVAIADCIDRAEVAQRASVVMVQAYHAAMSLAATVGAVGTVASLVKRATLGNGAPLQPWMLRALLEANLVAAAAASSSDAAAGGAGPHVVAQAADLLSAALGDASDFSLTAEVATAFALNASVFGPPPPHVRAQLGTFDLVVSDGGDSGPSADGEEATVTLADAIEGLAAALPLAPAAHAPNSAAADGSTGAAWMFPSPARDFTERLLALFDAAAADASSVSQLSDAVVGGLNALVGLVRESRIPSCADAAATYAPPPPEVRRLHSEWTFDMKDHALNRFGQVSVPYVQAQHTTHARHTTPFDGMH
jgi:hypothetical protein